MIVNKITIHFISFFCKMGLGVGIVSFWPTISKILVLEGQNFPKTCIPISFSEMWMLNLFQILKYTFFGNYGPKSHNFEP